MLSGLKLLALALFLYDLYQLRKIEKKEDAEAAAALEERDNLKLSSSIVSLDKCKAKPSSSPSISIHTNSRSNSIDRAKSFVHEREPMISAWTAKKLTASKQCKTIRTNNTIIKLFSIYNSFCKSFCKFSLTLYLYQNNRFPNLCSLAWWQK